MQEVMTADEARKRAERVETALNLLQQVPEAFPEKGMVSVRTLKAFSLLVETVLEEKP